MYVESPFVTMDNQALQIQVGRTIFHAHPENRAIARTISDFVLTPREQRLMTIGVATWPDLAQLLEDAYEGLGVMQLADPGGAVQRFAKDYVVPAMVMSEAWVKEGVLSGEYDVNSLRRRYEALKEVEQDITEARKAGAKYSELASLHSIRAKLLQDIDDASERWGLAPTRKHVSEVTQTKVDLSPLISHLSGNRPQRPSRPASGQPKDDDPGDVIDIT